MISSLLSRELSNSTNILNIPSNNIYFEKFLKSLDVKIFSLDHLYVGNCVPDIVLLNNRTQSLEKIISVCQYHQCNLVVVDHEVRSDTLDVSKVQKKIDMLPNVWQIAIDDQVKQSWGNIHDIVLGYGSNAKEWEQIFNEQKKRRYIYE
jgi:hypothetical protein